MSAGTKRFSAPEGIGSPTDDDFGKLTREDIIKGALATYGYNDRGNKIINITEMADEKNVREELLGINSSTPRLIQSTGACTSKMSAVKSLG
jgi:hypothetical protein